MAWHLAPSEYPTMFSGVRILMKGKLESRARDAANAVFPQPASPGCRLDKTQGLDRPKNFPSRARLKGKHHTLVGCIPLHVSRVVKKNCYMYMLCISSTIRDVVLSCIITCTVWWGQDSSKTLPPIKGEYSCPLISQAKPVPLGKIWAKPLLPS